MSYKRMEQNYYKLKFTKTNLDHGSTKRRKWLLSGNSGACKQELLEEG